MRLLSTRPNLPVLEQPTSRPPPYAILSHTWGADEISFREAKALSEGGKLTVADVNRAGWDKVFEACEVAERRGYGHLWIDTCCIDKTNSTELSEAINSMFRWYAEAEVCYAYLSDVPGEDHVAHRHSKFRASRWFTRGWTLQELLAPKEVHFYSMDWKFLGSKTDLKELVSSITGIPVEVLVGGECQAPARSIGEIFSWASRRNTTLPEDMAYSLLGLLDINLPLIYGEGPAAFMRVQEEVLRRHDDESIFAWEAPPSEAITRPLSGLLSPSVAYFHASHRFVKPRIWTRLDSQPVMMTNKGISVDLLLVSGDEENSRQFALLNCRMTGSNEFEVQPGIRVQHMGGRQYARVDIHHIHVIRLSDAQHPHSLTMNRNMIFAQKPEAPKPIGGFFINKEQTFASYSGKYTGYLQKSTTLKVLKRFPENRWTESRSGYLFCDCSITAVPTTGEYNSWTLPSTEMPIGQGQDTPTFFCGFLTVAIYQETELIGTANIVFGQVSQANLPGVSGRARTWCRLAASDDMNISTPSDQTRLISEAQTELTFSVPARESRPKRNVILHIGVAETQMLGRVVYGLSLAKSRTTVT